METVKSLADSGVKFFDQGVAFQINALVNIREGVKKLSTELKEVVKEKEELKLMVTKLKAEKDILEKLLKNKLNEEKQSVAVSNCLIVTDKFARSLSSIIHSGGNQQDIDLESVVVQDLIKKVRESHKRQRSRGGQDLSTSSRIPPDQPSFLAMEKGSSLELRSHTSNVQSASENLQPSLTYTDAGKEQEDLVPHDGECDLPGYAAQGSNESQTILTHQCNQSISTDSSIPASRASETCSVYGTTAEKSDEPGMVDMTVKAEPSCYEDERPPLDVIEKEGSAEQEDLRQPEFGSEEELPFLVTPAEPAVGANDPMEATLTMFVVNEPMVDPPVTVGESGQATAPVSSSLDRVGYSKHARTSWRGLDSRRSNTPIHVRRGSGTAGSPSASGALSSRVPSGQRIMIPKYRSSLYHSPRPTSAVGRPSSGNFEIPSSSLVNPGLASTSGTTRGYQGLQCDVCGKQFPKNENLLNHIRVHTGEKPFKCLTCGRNFSDGTNLRRHQKVHTGERPYGCSFCDKTFATSTNRNIHERIHTGEYPYRCKYCPKRFNRHGNLARHEKRHLSQSALKGSLSRTPTEVNDSQVKETVEHLPDQDGAKLSFPQHQFQSPRV